jgi:PKD repeat protein
MKCADFKIRLRGRLAPRLCLSVADTRQRAWAHAPLLVTVEKEARTRTCLSRIGLVAVVFAAASLIGGAGSAQAKEPTPAPPITLPPSTGDTAPPPDEIVDSKAPVTGCGGWHRESNYGGRWPTGSTWWEYSCGPCIPGCAVDESTSFTYDHYYWDGNRSVFYGQWYTESNMQGDPDPCSYWWDEAAGLWYGPYACTRETDAPPYASFTISCAGLSCSFDGSGSTDSDGTVQYFLWTFGDGSDASDGVTATHVYAQGGTYTVYLGVTDDLGLTTWNGKSVSVGSQNALPTPRFTFTCSGLSCSFDGSASADSDGAIVTHLWNFGDGSTGSGPTAQHRYAVAGTYRATLTVTDDSNASAVDSKPVTVSNVAPTAAFTISCSGLTCSFDGGRSTDSDGTIASYRWDFGDGTTGVGKLVQHTYGQPRTYSVGLSVTDNDGATGTDSKAFNPISLSARGYKLNGLRKVELSWSGPTGTSFDIYRDGAKIATVQTSAYTDSLNTKGPGSYVYEACASASSICSNQATVRF